MKFLSKKLVLYEFYLKNSELIFFGASLQTSSSLAIKAAPSAPVI
ncbi:MAG: hypothetical protein ACE5KT_09740 [Methanosarcinales archaeon]